MASNSSSVETSQQMSSYQFESVRDDTFEQSDSSYETVEEDSDVGNNVRKHMM